VANVVVVGGGFAGLSAAARLAKLRHNVTVVEATSRLGGRLRGVDIDGQPWPLDVETVTLPGVFRDLFRKSGRPLERSLDLTLTPSRRHLFRGLEPLDLPFGDHALQHDAIAAVLEPEFGVPDQPADVWSDWIDSWPERWDVMRRTLLDRTPTGRGDLDRAARRTLDVRRSLARLVDRELDDSRLQKLVLDPIRLEGQDRRTTPGFTGVRHYLDRTFGRWEFAGGFAGLADALEIRLGERKVTLALGERAHELTFSGTGTGRPGTGDTVTSVVTDRRSLPADLVIWCAPTWPAPLRQPPGLQAMPSSRTFLTLSPDAPDLPRDLLAHTNPPVRLTSHGDGRCTLIHQGGEDPVISLVRAGLDLRKHIVDRSTLAPPALVGLGHWGWAWCGWTTLDDHPGVNPQHGVHFAGAHAWPGGTLEEIGMATAAIAEAIGPAPR